MINLDLSATTVTTDALMVLADAPALEMLTIDDTIPGTATLEEVKAKLPYVRIVLRGPTGLDLGEPPAARPEGGSP